MKRVYIAKRGRGFLPACPDSEQLHSKLEVAEVIAIKPLRVRGLKAHRRYWLLMTMCADNCERIEIAPGHFMAVSGKDDVHTAVKLCTGHSTPITDAQGFVVAHIPKSTSFDEMTK